MDTTVKEEKTVTFVENIVIFLIIMNNSDQSLPNQVGVPIEVTTQTDENMEIKEMKDQIKEIQKYISKSDDSNEKSDVKLKSTVKQNVCMEDCSLGRWIVRIITFIFTCVAGYWIYETLVTFQSGSLYAATSIVHNASFTWPTITIEPPYTCFNKTAITELQKTYNITPNNKWDALAPFEVKDDFDWSVSNASEIYLKSKYMPQVECTYMTKSLNETNCNGEEYIAQFNRKVAFRPDPAKNKDDFIHMTINTQNCDEYTPFRVAISSPTDKYLLSASNFKPNAYYLSGKNIQLQGFPLAFVYSGRVTAVYVEVEEFTRFPTEATPCVEDINYSKMQCYEDRIIEYKVMEAGCYFPAITGYQEWMSRYPECNNSTYYHRFMEVHRADKAKQYSSEDLNKILRHCQDPCHVKKYTISTEEPPSNMKKPYGGLHIHMNIRGMKYVSVTEKKAMTLEMLVANVGGILGLFLGISCVSVIDAVQFLVRKGRQIIGKHEN